MSGPGPEAATGFRIVRGRPTEADLAALTAVLLSRLAAAAHGAETAEPPRTAGWRRPEPTFPHRDPRGWRAGGAGRN
ncbi:MULTISPECIES: acyl-CoA carboxylase subunit epsilon [unclassified Streptomyces]|nr:MULTISPECIES: acyl-CoA carboxylase subunit epsilon [unclassified Streptomyces]ARI53180.1 hypothetical protein A6E92_13945 [Streptomyces sp. S8]MYT96401.1 acyl-CoA carboxylase subunit epsilon [Streptomyces sp. SID8350]NGO84867.1 acyl-CoA carboxylase subunit epsilon [Streptomyces sp. 196(2019)]SCK62777.1 Acyl-CoA carboxylase epsilon subunit [Streptomyces sp. AmelKG-D3]